MVVALHFTRPAWKILSSHACTLAHGSYGTGPLSYRDRTGCPVRPWHGPINLDALSPLFAAPLLVDQVPVSIADLGGTEIDLRFKSSSQGSLSVVVAPVLRFSDSERFHNKPLRCRSA